MSEGKTGKTPVLLNKYVSLTNKASDRKKELLHLRDRNQVVFLRMGENNCNLLFYLRTERALALSKCF